MERRVDRWISLEQFEVWIHGDYFNIHLLSTSIHQEKHDRLTLIAFILTLIRFCTSNSWLAFSCCTTTHSFSHITHVQRGHWIKIFFYYLMTTAEAPSTPPTTSVNDLLLVDISASDRTGKCIYQSSFCLIKINMSKVALEFNNLILKPFHNIDLILVSLQIKI